LGLSMSCNCPFRRTLISSDITFEPKRTVYLDYNATTPVDFRVLSAFEDACRLYWGNPSSLHSAGTTAWEKLGSFKKTIGDRFLCDPSGIKFCSSGSEAIHAALWGILSRNKNISLITTKIEHTAILHPARHIAASGRQVFFCPVDENGQIIPDELNSLLLKNPGALVTLSPVNHETGSWQPVQEIYKAVKLYDGLLFLDAVQAAARLKPDTWAPFCDIFCCSAHKLYAPKGTALLWTKQGLRLRPCRFGGHQEDSIFPGTENIPGIAAFAHAVELLVNNFEEEQRHLAIMKKEGTKILLDNLPEIIIESPETSVPCVLCVSLPWIEDMESLLFNLHESGICISRFSACSDRVTGPSKVLLSMHRPAQRAARSLRIALGRWSKRDDFFRLVKVLKTSLPDPKS
jgi:cysteine desulfurase